MINDQTLDLVFNFLKTYSLYFQKNLQRKPTIEELQSVINISFSANIDENLFSECEEKSITEVKFKINKKKKVLKYMVGDMCAIPLKCGGYAFSRIIILEPPMWYLSEIFAYYSEDKSYRKEIDKSGYLFPPVFITPNLYKIWNSPVIHKILNYRSSAYDEQYYYYYGVPNDYWKVKIGEQGKGIHITKEEAKRYPKMVYNYDIQDFIEKNLVEKGLIR